MGSQTSSLATLGGAALRPVVDLTKQPISVNHLLYQLADGPLRAGDMIFTTGCAVGSLIYIWAGWSKFSHVMMVDRDPSNPTMPCFVWESVSHPDGLVDVHTGTSIKFGCRLVLAKEHLESAARRDKQSRILVGIVRLHMPSRLGPPNDTRLKFYKALSALQPHEYHKAYERQKMNLIAVEYSKIVGENIRDNSEYFCSELVAETYRQLRVIKDETNSSMISPKNLSEHLNGVICINGFLLGPELYLYAVDIDPPPATASAATITTNE